MGGNGSKLDEAVLDKFTSEEKSELDRIFNRLALNKRSFQYEDLHKYLKQKLPEPIIKSIFKYMCQHNEHPTDHSINFTSFVSSLAVFLKGSIEERAQVLILLATGDDREPISAQEMFDVALKLIKIYDVVVAQTPEIQNWGNLLQSSNFNSFSHFLLRDLFFPEKNNKDHIKDEIPEQVYTQDDLEKWLARAPLAVHIMEAIFSFSFPLSKLVNIEIPVCTQKHSKESLLDVASILALNSYLPRHLRKEWRQLYSTKTDGESFTVFFHQIQQKGPTIIIIKDKDGHIFGGFASQDWELNASFRGTSECFLFSIRPLLKCYSATGYNNHFMYLNQNQQTLPNGLGFGGQLEYFGIWLDKDFGQGSCGASCATYNCPQLSGQQHFNVENLEVWAVGPLPTEEEDGERVRGSVLDRDLEAKAMLEMLGRGPLSEGIREEDPTSDSPEEKTFILTQHEL